MKIKKIEIKLRVRMLYFTLRICIKCLYWKQRVVQSIAIISRVLARVVKRAPSDMYSLGFWSIVKSRWYKNVAKISNGFRFTFSPCILRSVIYNWRLRKRFWWYMPWNFPSPLVTLRFYLFRRPICGKFPVVLKGLVISSLLSIE